MTFRIMAWSMAIGGALLGLRFVFAGGSVLAEWKVEATSGALVLCRRIGAIYLGLALLFLLGRGAGPSELRSAVCLGLGAALVLLAGLGPVELAAGRVSPRILVPSIIEAVLAAGFAWAWWTDR